MYRPKYNYDVDWNRIVTDLTRSESISLVAIDSHIGASRCYCSKIRNGYANPSFAYGMKLLEWYAHVVDENIPLRNGKTFRLMKTSLHSG